tara:strand:- start:36399 stop:38258 length:1860 start_codon:yes stop_codon:yes gene_type:complete
MASVINTNVASLNAQRNLTQSQSSLATSLERLSSGLRINSAKDDAAGLAISDRFTTQIRGLNQASRNANDAISLSQTAEGALGEVSSNLQRIRELAVQSANATNSSSDREAIDLEVQQRLAEIDRISSTTAFNGQKILDGTFGNAAFQVGANVGETISLDLSTSMRQGAIGNTASATSTIDLNTVASETGTAGTSTSAAISPTDFSTVAATLGTSTIQVTTAAVDADSLVVNGVTFTFAQGGSAGETVVDATNVTITRDMTGTPLTADTTASALSAGIAAYKADATPAYTAFDDVTAAASTDTVTLTYATAGLPSTNGNAIGTASGTLATTNAVDATGADADTSANESITIGGTAITLDSNITAIGDLVSVINNALTAASNTTVVASAGTGGELVLTTTATGAAATAPTPASVGTDAATMLGTIVDVAGAAGSTLTIASGGFDIQIGDATAVSVAAGDYTTAQSVVDAVNTALAGNATAELNDDGTMSIYSSEAITVSGTTGATTLGIPSAAVSTTGLTGLTVTSVSDSNDAIRRIDSALGAVSDLRSTFGAIQNRFESTISNLSTAVENLSAARSRILDADFAAETANLTRAQILQQAGTAMLSQANALPQNVLSLLG